MASISKFIVAGVIASTIPSRSVALLGNIEPSKVLRIGQFEGDLQLAFVNRKYVDFRRKGELVRIMVGDGLPELRPEIESHDTPMGRLTLMSETYKDDQLSAISIGRSLMQAGVEPIQHGDSIYYRIRFIEPGSIFDVIGLQNEDLITSINGQKLSEPGSAIKTLVILKTADSWSIEVLRGVNVITLRVLVN